MELIPTAHPADFQISGTLEEYCIEALSQRAKDWLTLYSNESFVGDGKIYVRHGEGQPLLNYISQTGFAIRFATTI